MKVRCKECRKAFTAAPGVTTHPVPIYTGQRVGFVMDEHGGAFYCGRPAPNVTFKQCGPLEVIYGLHQEG